MMASVYGYWVDKVRVFEFLQFRSSKQSCNRAAQPVKPFPPPGGPATIGEILRPVQFITMT